MTIDVRNNFGKVTVSTGYDDSATSIVLSSGHGANLPSSFSYNLVWYNATDYSDPADDPNKEIVRVTNLVTDTLTVTRGQEGVAATTKNTAAKTYKMVLSITAKMVDDIETDIAAAHQNRNIIINGDMSVAQRGTTFTSATTPTANNDNTYMLDRWLLLSDGNDIVDVSQQAGGGGVSGNDDYLRLDVETVSKKFGICQIVEANNLKPAIGDVVSLGFDARVTDATKLSDIRAVVLSWDSTADIVTSDVVSAWNAEGAVITPATNWTAENVAANLSVTTSWARYTIENISIDTASTTNVAVFIYQNNVATNDTAGIFLEITNVQLEAAAAVTDFERLPFGANLYLCRRYFEVFNEEAVASASFGMGMCLSTTLARSVLHYAYKRVAPTTSISAAGDFQVSVNVTLVDVTVLDFNVPNLTSAQMRITVASGLAADTATKIADDSNGNARVWIDAEL